MPLAISALPSTRKVEVCQKYELIIPPPKVRANVPASIVPRRSLRSAVCAEASLPDGYPDASSTFATSMFSDWGRHEL